MMVANNKKENARMNTPPSPAVKPQGIIFLIAKYSKDIIII
jgi:hypothetical protein